MPASTNKNPGCLSVLFNLFGRPRNTNDLSIERFPSDREPITYPYKVRDDFLSPAEFSFFQVIKTMMGEHLLICPKVSLADLFFVTRPHENKSALNRINRKHVDFLVCNPRTMKPMFGIELDDSSHTRPDRMDRDEFVEEVFKAAGLPLVRILVRASYNTKELEMQFKQALQSNPSLEAAKDNSDKTNLVAASENTKIPVCPKCGTPMVLRIARTGDQIGRKFYGCQNYPKCRVVFPLEN